MRETKNLEFKERMTNTFLKTVSAFANYGTGKIEFGITDNGTIIGVDKPKDFCLNIENKINDLIKPNPLLYTQIPKVVSFGKTKVLKIIKYLIKRGYVKKIGQGRGMKYMRTNMTY